MIGKVIAVLLTILVLLSLFTYVQDNIPKDAVPMVSTISIPETTKIIEYGSTPVFSEKLRFNHNNISYFIEDSCSTVRVSRMKEAFRVFEEKMEIIFFHEILNDRADIIVGCSDEFIDLGNNLFAAGEGGPSEIINTSNFKTIQKGKILLYEDQPCKMPVVEIHELCHVFGFDHSANPLSIMYNTSNCDQKITPDMIELMKELYSIKPLADARISEISAVKRGKYFDFNISVVNEGLVEIDNISLTLLTGDEIIEVISLNDIGIGYGRTLRARDLRLPSSKSEKIDFVVDYESVVEELDEENNIVIVMVASA